MTYVEAMDLLKAGKSVGRKGRTFRITVRGVFDVTNPEAPERTTMGDDERAATDWEAA